MNDTLWKILAGAAALLAFALGGAAIAAAGSGSTPTASPARTPEAPLTGDTLSKASAAALAKVGGTVDWASTETDGATAGAAYEVHVTKADGTHVEVILDQSFAVLAVQTGGPHGGRGHGRVGNGETPLTGDTGAKAKAAAVAKTGGTADFASTEADGTVAGAAYEVHVTKADGTHVVVILDTSFDVLAVDTKQHP